MLEAVYLFGHILYGGFFVFMGLNHFFNSTNLTLYAQSKKVPFAKLGVLLSGLMIFLGGLGVVFSVYVRESAILISIFLIIVTFTMHRFWTVSDPNMKIMEMTQFTKNMALLGAALMLL